MKKQEPKDLRRETKTTSTKSESRKKPNKRNEYTEKTPFKSKYKEGYVTPANFLAETIFEKRNEYFNSGKCPERFWTTGNKLHGAYKGQVIAAAKLLKKYNCDSIIKALKSEDGKFILKIQDPRLVPIIEKFEKNRVDKTLNQSYNTTESISKPFRSGRKNILRKL